MPRYEPKRIEARWQQYWEQHGTFVTPNDPPRGSRGKLYVLDMFPYPSGSGLHVGHPEGYTATDIVCRYRRMRGYHVLHPMGWDAFGLPAEQHAIRTGTHPRITTYQNIETFRRQLKMLGFSYDWSRELSTTDEDYFRWTQWIFLELFDTWYDPTFTWKGPDGKTRTGKGRPISDLPIPADVRAAGVEAVRRYQDRHRLAYVSEAPVNWCAELGTVLANEEVIDGKSERGGYPVTRIPLRQWMLRITAYADRLVSELEDLDWTESIKALQRNWIGRSTGAEVDFHVQRPEVRDQRPEASQTVPPRPAEQRSNPKTPHAGRGAGGEGLNPFDEWKTTRATTGFPADPEPDVLRIYTTRPDTLYGATYMVVAPEHPIVERITTPAQRAAVNAYREQASRKSDLDRTDLAKDKTGVFTGAYALNPVNGAQVPIWIADYVLISYGTGAIMAVPGHDLRDWEFAVKFGIPIIEVVQPTANYEPSKEERETFDRAQAQGLQPLGFTGIPFAGEGTSVNSADYNGLSTNEFKQRITADLATRGLGRQAVNYRLRDWLFSRQHFWGEPFPIWHELDADGNPTGLMRADTSSELPVSLPDDFEFKPHGRPEPPLEEAPESWLYKTADDGVRLKRETNSMPQWAGSCWYYLRFCDPTNEHRFVDPDVEKYWMPVDLYIGGAEHAVLHLLYSRFWHKLLFDRGHVCTPEPFQKLVNQGMILGENNEKMSKSRGNVVNPDDVVADYGADALRLYEMFMGPLEQVKPWSMKGVEGVYRFLGRVWRMFVDDKMDEVALAPAVQDVPPTQEQERLLHKTIKAVTDDIDKLSLNTAISRMMEFTNELTGCEVRPRALLQPFVLILSPFAPHLAEELWSLLGHKQSLAYELWPAYDESKLVSDEIEIPVQISGKIKARIRVPPTADAATIEQIARADAAVCKQLEGKTVQKIVVVPGRMVNIVAKS